MQAPLLGTPTPCLAPLPPNTHTHAHIHTQRTQHRQAGTYIPQRLALLAAGQKNVQCSEFHVQGSQTVHSVGLKAVPWNAAYLLSHKFVVSIVACRPVRVRPAARAPVHHYSLIYLPASANGQVDLSCMGPFPRLTGGLFWLGVACLSVNE